MEINTLLDILYKIRNLGNREGISYNNGYRTFRLSYAQLYQKIINCTYFFYQKGLYPGDRILLWGENCPEWVIIFWAALARGLHMVPIDFRFSIRFVERIQKETSPKLLFYGETVSPSFLSLDTFSFSAIHSLQDYNHIEYAEDTTEETIVEIVYTSGTTGEPKGVVHKHKNICANLRPLAKEINRYKWILRPFQPIRILNLLPLSHMFGQSLGLFIPLLLEGSTVFMREYHPGAITEAIRKEKVTTLVSIPKILKQLQEHIERNFQPFTQALHHHGFIGFGERLWKFRKIHKRFGWKFWAFVVGGAQIAPQLEQWWTNLGFLVVQGYGLTEASPVVAVNHPFQAKQGSLGKVIEGQEVRIAPDGEILVKGENIVSEYFSGGKKESFSADQWLHTGDIGEIDQEGRLYYKGKKKDVIVTSDGMNVYPEDVEKELNALPEIKESTVIGLKKDKDTEVHAVILLQDHSAKIQRLIQKANKNLEPFQRIKSWSIWPNEDFPRTPSTMKIKRGEVAKCVDGTQKSKKVTEERKPEGLYSILAQLSGLNKDYIHEQMGLSEDLGLSSLDQVELMAALEEQYSIDLDETLIGSISTVKELKELLENISSLSFKKSTPSLDIEEKEVHEQSSSSHEKLSKPVKERYKTPATPPLPRWSRTLPVRLLRNIFQNAILIPSFRVYMNLEVQGQERLANLKPPLIFAANHSSHLDTTAILAALPYKWRFNLAPAMLLEYFQAHFSKEKFPWSKRLSSGIQYFLACILFNGYPLPQRMGGLREVLKYTGELIEHNYCPLIFPEGIMTTDGHLQPFKPGIGLMAIQLKVPVLPVFISGLFDLFPVYDKWPRPGSVRVKIGSPIWAMSNDTYESVSKKVEKKIQLLAQNT